MANTEKLAKEYKALVDFIYHDMEVGEGMFVRPCHIFPWKKEGYPPHCKIIWDLNSNYSCKYRDSPRCFEEYAKFVAARQSA
jgi:hypothetical protein